jgi:SAM-dependent methyltransferase
MTQTGNDEFDGLGRTYDTYRPRYPDALFDAVAAAVPGVPRPRIADTGAGTGVALEGLVPRLRAGALVEAVDTSADMVARGREKFPSVTWHVAAAEPFLEAATGIHLVVAAQAYQWMDRPRYRRAAARCLAPGGSLAIMQNNRDFTASAFLDAYECLLEELSPGYSRFYRTLPIEAELREEFGAVSVHRVRWAQRLPAAAFAGLSQTSTQVRRAIAEHGGTFLARLAGLGAEHQVDGQLTIPYTSEAFLASGR